jgi:hypothetical protein
MATKHPIRRQLSNNELLPLIAPSACIHRRLRECQRPQSTDLVRARTSQRANGTTVSSPARTDQILTAGSPRRRAPPEVRSRRGGEGFRPDVGARVQGVCRESAGSLPGVDVRVLLYCFKPPFPSDGGFAAASAGRWGLRPSRCQSRSRCRVRTKAIQKRIQAGRWTAGQLHCETSRVGRDAALKGPLRRPPAALDRCSSLGLDTAS